MKRLFSSFMHAINSPFHHAQNRYFTDMIQSLRPGYTPPSKTDTTERLLDTMYEKKTEQCAKTSKGKVLNLMDGAMYATIQ